MTALPDITSRPTFLRQLVEKRFRPYAADRAEAGRPLTRLVLRDFDEFDGCGNVRRRSATMRCTKCFTQVTIPLRCKRRGWCPPCLRWRQRDRTDFLEQRIFGDTPVQQWVLTFPQPLRVSLAFEPELVTKILKRYMDLVTQRQRRCAKHLLKIRKADILLPGAATVIQRFGTTLALNLHLHSAITKGVFYREKPEDPLTFVELPEPTPREIAGIALKVCAYAKALLARKGAWQDVHGPWMDDLDAVAGFVTLGKDDRSPTFVRWAGVASDTSAVQLARDNVVYAFDLQVGKAVRGRDRKNLRKLFAYMLRPPFAERDIQPDPESDNHVLVTLKHATRNGTVVLRLTITQLFDRLVWMVPRKNANLIRFHAAFASRFRARTEVVPVPHPEPPREPNEEETATDLAAWSEFKTHSYPEDKKSCPTCRGRMKLIVLKSDRLLYYRKTAIPPDD